MKNDACERYLEDPDANRAHLEECAECRLLSAALDAPARYDAIALHALPVAPWEEAGHKPWALIAGGAVVIVTALTGLYAAAGISPANVLSEPVTALRAMPTIVSRAGEVLHHASTPVQGLFAAVAVSVNLLLVALLRRAPRGIDAAR